MDKFASWEFHVVIYVVLHFSLHSYPSIFTSLLHPHSLAFSPPTNPYLSLLSFSPFPYTSPFTSTPQFVLLTSLSWLLNVWPYPLMPTLSLHFSPLSLLVYCLHLYPSILTSLPTPYPTLFPFKITPHPFNYPFTHTPPPQFSYSFLLSPFSFLLSPFSFLLSPFSFLLSPFPVTPQPLTHASLDPFL